MAYIFEQTITRLYIMKLSQLLKVRYTYAPFAFIASESVADAVLAFTRSSQSGATTGVSNMSSFLDPVWDRDWKASEGDPAGTSTYTWLPSFLPTEALSASSCAYRSYCTSCHSLGLFDLPFILNIVVFKPWRYCRSLCSILQRQRSRSDWCTCFTQIYDHWRGRTWSCHPELLCYRVWKRSKHQRKCPFFNIVHPQHVSAIQVCTLQTSRRYEAEQTGEGHVGRNRYDSSSYADLCRTADSTPGSSCISLIVASWEVCCSRDA